MIAPARPATSSVPRFPVALAALVFLLVLAPATAHAEGHDTPGEAVAALLDAFKARDYDAMRTTVVPAQRENWDGHVASLRFASLTDYEIIDVVETSATEGVVVARWTATADREAITVWARQRVEAEPRVQEQDLPAETIERLIRGVAGDVISNIQRNRRVIHAGQVAGRWYGKLDHLLGGDSDQHHMAGQCEYLFELLQEEDGHVDLELVIHEDYRAEFDRGIGRLLMNCATIRSAVTGYIAADRPIRSHVIVQGSLDDDALAALLKRTLQEGLAEDSSVSGIAATVETVAALVMEADWLRTALEDGSGLQLTLRYHSEGLGGDWMITRISPWHGPGNALEPETEREMHRVEIAVESFLDAIASRNLDRLYALTAPDKRVARSDRLIELFALKLDPDFSFESPELDRARTTATVTVRWEAAYSDNWRHPWVQQETARLKAAGLAEDDAKEVIRGRARAIHAMAQRLRETTIEPLVVMKLRQVYGVWYVSSLAPPPPSPADCLAEVLDAIRTNQADKVWPRMSAVDGALDWQKSVVRHLRLDSVDIGRPVSDGSVARIEWYADGTFDAAGFATTWAMRLAMAVSNSDEQRDQLLEEIRRRATEQGAKLAARMKDGPFVATLELRDHQWMVRDLFGE